MSESAEHIAMVERVLKHIHKEYCEIRTLYSVTDLPGKATRYRPPIIGGYVPDVYCTDTRASLLAVGEAKTSRDLHTPRSLDQISAFYRHITNAKGGYLVIGVPWTEEPFVFNFVKRLAIETPLKQAKVSIITEMRVLPCF